MTRIRLGLSPRSSTNDPYGLRGTGNVRVGMAPAWKWLMRTTQHVFNEVCGRPTVFAIKVEAKSPALRLLEYVVPLA